MRAFRNSAANVAASLARRPICSLTIAEKMDNLRQSVNGKAMVRTRCTSQDHEVEEMTEIVGVSGCI
jgi:hypothetical protein